MRSCLATLTLLSSAFIAGPAAAQAAELPDGVLLILNGANTADEPAQQLTLVEVGNVLGARGIDFTVIGEHECTLTSDGCLALRDEHDAEAVVIISVYRGDPGRVDLQLFDAERSGEGSQSWLGDPSTAAGQAIQGALETFAPESVRVIIAGTPEGATVWLGRRTGNLPFIGTVSPGRHRLRVTADGYRTHTESLEVPATTEQWTHQVRLEEGRDPVDGPESSDASTADTAGQERNGLQLGLGVTGLALGVGTAIGGVILLTQDGCELDGCRRDPEAPAIIRRRETTGAGAGLLVAGVALAGLGVALTVAGLQIDGSADATGARLRISGTF